MIAENHQLLEMYLIKQVN